VDGPLFTWLAHGGCIDDTEPSTPSAGPISATSRTARTTSSASTTCATTWCSRWSSASSEATRMRSSTRSTRFCRRGRTPLIIRAVGSEADEKYAQFNAQVVRWCGTDRGRERPHRQGERCSPTRKRRTRRVLLYQAQLGMPRTRSSSSCSRSLGEGQVQRVELDVLADRKLRRASRRCVTSRKTLFRARRAGHSVHLTDKGVETMSPRTESVRGPRYLACRARDRARREPRSQGEDRASPPGRSGLRTKSETLPSSTSCSRRTRCTSGRWITSCRRQGLIVDEFTDV